LLIVDDAHRLGATLADIARTAARAKSVRLLVATRLAAIKVAESQLSQNGYEERMDPVLRLAKLSPDNMLELAKDVLGEQHSLQATRLAALAGGCPLLVIIGGALVRSGKLAEDIKDAETFRERVFKGFKEDFLRLLPENKRERTGMLMQILSFISPAPKNEEFYKMVAETIGCSELQMAQDLDSLQAAGLVLENKEGVRLYPDLFSDAILLDACLDSSKQVSLLCKTLLSQIPVSRFPAVMRNVAQADWELRTKKETPNSLFEPLWQQFMMGFKEAGWPDNEQNLTNFWERMAEHDLHEKKPNRSELLSEWAGFAIYLPERTLELAKLAIDTAQPTVGREPSDADKQRAARAEVCSALPPMLVPIATWHPLHASQALDLLWSLDFGNEAGSSTMSNPIAAIAAAASFGVHKPMSFHILDWLEQKFSEPDGLERIRQTPWIVSALLKPFFERMIEHQWATSKVLHVQPIHISVPATRPLRRRALAITEKLLLSNDKFLVTAALPVVNEALSPLYSKFGAAPSPADYEAWRPDRLEALRVIERAISEHKSSPVFLFQLHQILRERADHDFDTEIKAECRRVFDSIPKSFELDALRVLGSWSGDLLDAEDGPNFEERLAIANKQWDAFCGEVAKEAASRFPGARQLCDFIREEKEELAGTNAAFQADAILAPVAALSSAWCISLLQELSTTEDPSLDRSLWKVLRQGVVIAPNDYRAVVEHVTYHGRPEQACSLMSFLGSKQTHFGGLDDFERKILVRLATRPEPTVVSQLAQMIGLHFRNQPAWALTILSLLKQESEDSVTELLEAMDHLLLSRLDDHTADLIGRCFANAGELLLANSYRIPHLLQNLAQKFPKQLYEHLRDLLNQLPSGESTPRRVRRAAESFSLGPMNLSDYVSGEVEKQWKKARAGGSDAEARLALTRLLIWSEGASGTEQLRKLIEDCQNGDQLRLAAKIAAVHGSTFVFQLPDFVRVLLTRGKDLLVTDAIREALFDSACGGGRSFTNGDLNPEYRYIAEKGQDLANRYKDDPVLGPFYRMIVDSERQHGKMHQEWFRAEDEAEG
jgi:hypothetical protein